MSRAGPALEVVVAGGGIAGLEMLLALRELAGDRVELTLLEPSDELVLVQGGVVEPFRDAPPDRHPVEAFCAAAGARHVRDAVAEVDTGAREVRTAAGESLPYDAFAATIGARAGAVVEHALTWWPAGDRTGFRALLDDIEHARVRSVAFVVPARPAWTMPAYELALLVARRTARVNVAGLELTLVTPEPEPMAAFGPVGAGAVAAELAAAGVRFHGSAIATVARQDDGSLIVRTRPSEDALTVDAVVALPRVHGRALPGLRADMEGFLPVDACGRVAGAERVWAAGDGTTVVPKQGGLAALQAEAAAWDIAALAGAAGAGRRFRPVLRAALVTGRGHMWLRRDLADPTDPGVATDHPLWWPPAKVAAPRIATVLAAREREARAARAAG